MVNTMRSIYYQQQQHHHQYLHKRAQLSSLLLTFMSLIITCMLLLAFLSSSSSSLLEAATIEQSAAGEQTASGEAQEGESQTNGQIDHLVGGFKLSKLFDFSEYKRIYRKKYTSAIQELARMKLYLGGVLKVIIAAIKHRFFGKKYYLAVNRMTDWTDDEWRGLLVDASVIRGEQSEQSETLVSDENKENHFETADVNDIDTKLPEFFKGNEAILQKFVDEIGGPSNDEGQHNSNQQSSDEQKLSANMLFRSPEEQGAIYRLPKSNNRNYVSPELMSQADNSEQTEKPLDSKATEEISHSPSTDLFDYMLDGLALLFGSGDSNSSGSGGGDSGVEKKIEIFSEGPDEIFVDHRESGCLSPPTHQLECGSCYAFASLALYEYLFCMQYNNGNQPGEERQPVKFAPQYLIDCGPKKDKQYMRGCMGGNPIKVAEFVNEYGIELEANYPYQAKEQVCAYDDDVDSQRMGYIRVEEPGLKVLKQFEIDDILKKQPILINIYPNSELKSYAGGIYDNYACEFKYGHAMLLVGSGRKDNQEYWIIRNSLGSEWGEKGYLYMSKGAVLNCMIDDGTTSYAKFPSANMNPEYARKDVLKLLSRL